MERKKERERESAQTRERQSINQASTSSSDATLAKAASSRLVLLDRSSPATSRSSWYPCRLPPCRRCCRAAVLPPLPAPTPTLLPLPSPVPLPLALRRAREVCVALPEPLLLCSACRSVQRCAAGGVGAGAAKTSPRSLMMPGSEEWLVAGELTLEDDGRRACRLCRTGSPSVSMPRVHSSMRRVTAAGRLRRAQLPLTRGRQTVCGNGDRPHE